MAGLGLHPRLARALLDGAPLVGARPAAEVVALLDDDTLADGHRRSTAELRRLRSGTAAGAARWRAEVARLRRLLPRPDAVRGAADGRPADRRGRRWWSRWPIPNGSPGPARDAPACT